MKKKATKPVYERKMVSYIYKFLSVELDKKTNTIVILMQEKRKPK